MANTPLQNESVPAKSLSLHAVGLELESLQLEAEELAKLIYLASGNDTLDPNVSSAMRGLMTLAEALSGRIDDLSKTVFAASSAQRGQNVVDLGER